MKHLLNGVAIAAALAIAAPAWAQAPMTPNAAAPKAAAPVAPAASAPMAPMARKQRHKRMTHHMMAKHGGAAMSTTDQLNREELARIQGGGAAPMPAPGMAGQPNELRGIPGSGQPSASEHPGVPR